MPHQGTDAEFMRLILMQGHYRIYLLGHNFLICVAEDVFYGDDEAACEAAAELSNGQAWELWYGTELIHQGFGDYHVPGELLHYMSLA